MISEYFRINQDVTFICQVKMYYANYRSKLLKANSKIHDIIYSKMILKVNNVFLTQTHSNTCMHYCGGFSW